MHGDLTLGRRRGNDVVEAHRSCGPAEFDEAEMPNRLRHRAPLFALAADIERPASSADERRVVAARPAGNARPGRTWDPRVDERAHTMGDGEAIDEDHAVALAQCERPGCATGAERERPRGLKPGGSYVWCEPSCRPGRLDEDQNREGSDRADTEAQAARSHSGDTQVAARRVPRLSEQKRLRGRARIPAPLSAGTRVGPDGVWMRYAWP